MHRHSRQISLLIAFVASVFLHITVFVPMLAAMATAPADQRRVAADLKPEDFHPPDELPKNDIQLGIDKGTPSTFTWVGFDEYQKHLAALAQVEQAAFTQDTPGSVSPSPKQPNEENKNSESESVNENPIEILQTQTAVVNDWLDSVSNSLAAIAAISMRSLLENNRTVQEVQVDPVESPEEKPKQSSSDAIDEVGVRSDKESDPTSVIDVPRDQWQLGKPLAAQGLELKPSRPSFTVLTLLTASPGDPLCEIEFDSDGIPVIAKIIEPSGDPRVDDAILASLYRWRASGNDLNNLQGDQTVIVRIRILLLPQK